MLVGAFILVYRKGCVGSHGSSVNCRYSREGRAMPGPILSLHYVVIAVAALVIALAIATETADAQPTCALTQGAPSIAGSPAASAIPNHIVEQYKAYLTDLGNIGSRFGTVQVFYLTIVAALIGVLSLKDTNRSVRNFLSPVSVVVFLFIAVI